MGAVRRLEFVREVHFGGLYRCEKFGWNRCSCLLKNTQGFRLCEFGLKMPIHGPFLVFWDLIP